MILLNSVNQYIVLIILLMMIGLSLIVLNDSFLHRRQRTLLLMIIALVISLILQNYIEYILVNTITLRIPRTLIAIYGYTVRPVILVLFMYLVDPKRNYRNMWVILGVNTAVYYSALFSDICFRINEENVYVAGPLSSFCFIISAFLLSYLLYLTIQEYGTKIKELLIPLFIYLSIIVSAMLDYNITITQPVSFLTLAVVSGSLFYYIWLHLQFEREHEEDLMAQQRIRIMMTQIQPHFLFNTLSTIRVLCTKDPEQAAYICERFAQYLRQNLDSLEFNGMIPFEKELEHTRVYADIEKVRFPSVTVEYDIQDTDFSVPPLTLQPIVENAIRHGVRIRENGLIKISTKKSSLFHELIVEDNGSGFDTSNLNQTDPNHIGIRNVRERIEKMCGGTLTINSHIGIGTIVIILIPITNNKFKEENK